jgi:hypothetical protein
MMEYLKNIILIENRTLFHVKKSVKMQNLKKITKNRKNWLQIMLISVSNPVYTDTGIPVFGTPNTDTGKNLLMASGKNKLCLQFG